MLDRNNFHQVVFFAYAYIKQRIKTSENVVTDSVIAQFPIKNLYHMRKI